MKLISWNVNGIRAIAKKGFREILRDLNADVVCLQETKAHREQLGDELISIEDYKSFWSSALRKGYSGVATYCKQEPCKIDCRFDIEERFDVEGRILETEFDDFTLLNIYFPNGQRDDERLQYKLDFYDATLTYCEKLRAEHKKLIICGDFNTAHKAIDLARPEANRSVSGFLEVECAWMDKFVSFGYVDTFRLLHPKQAEAYSWWSYRTRARARNVGWRLDYFFVSPELVSAVKSAEILTDIQGSDHCPVMLELQ